MQLIHVSGQISVLLYVIVAEVSLARSEFTHLQLSLFGRFFAFSAQITA